ncbi:TonB-dependent receptor [Kordiimonas sp. SCSIO 12603]|uniref:TonB-dependent receptor plug domain-containing protein n=1 Tax=Kordiimonas sp. SCSIO 12603 TaxID=2829596 RepID=UPI002106D271|nr:TonB-dependent receptor [Kordiimonas sp. SCSIO 12603]UTW57423.1 TonB-dependent receptor [Kordiimonas sp. SCSIO 12603]
MQHLKNSVCITALLAGGFYSAPTLAQDEAADDIETIYVTVNRREQPLSQIGSSVSVLTDIDLQKGQNIFVVDALEVLPSVNIAQNGSFGGLASLSLRGAGGDSTAVLIDGVQLNDASSTGNGYNFAHLDTNNIERIEVLRGPQSVLYGSDAIGGVVNIITKTGGDGLGGNAYAEYGSYNTFRTGGTLHGGTKKLGFNLAASFTDTDGISAADENDGNTERDGLRSYNISGKVTSEISEDLRFEVISRYSDNASEFDSFGPIDGDEVAHTDEFLIAGRAHFNLFDGRLQNTVSAEFSSIERENFTNGASSFEAQGNRTNFDYLGVFEATEDWTVTFGAQHEVAKATNLEGDGISIDSVFGELGWTPVDGLVLTAGIRQDDHETFGGATTTRFTGSYQVTDTTRLIANWGEGFKAPSVFQLTFVCTFCGLTEPSSDLRPERAKGYEFGVEQTFLEGDLLLSATWFNLKTRDAIDFTFTNGYANVDSRRSEGLELGLQAILSDTLDVSANYTYTDAVDTATDIAIERQPENQFSATVNWAPVEAVNLRATLVHNGEEEQSFGAETLEAWTRLDLRASFQINDRVSVYGRIDNLFDEEYQSIIGYGTPDRSAYVGLRVNL